MKSKNSTLQPGALLAELFGTFVLTTAALTVGGNPLFVGLTLLVLVLGIGVVSGAHVNPAVTFGLWSTKRLETLKLPFYWAMQIAGALLGLLIVQLFKDTGYGISLASFTKFDLRVVIAELVGVLVFTFIIAAAVDRKLAESAKALAIGVGLTTGLVIGGGLIGVAAQNAGTTGEEAERVTVVDGAILNPAIALAATETDTEAAQNAAILQQLGQAPEPSTKKPASRFTLETIVGGLLGGALGMNLYFVVAGINPFAKEKTSVATKVKKVVKKAKK